MGFFYGSAIIISEGDLGKGPFILKTMSFRLFAVVLLVSMFFNICFAANCLLEADIMLSLALLMTCCFSSSGISLSTLIVLIFLVSARKKLSADLLMKV